MGSEMCIRDRSWLVALVHATSGSGGTNIQLFYYYYYHIYTVNPKWRTSIPRYWLQTLAAPKSFHRAIKNSVERILQPAPRLALLRPHQPAIVLIAPSTCALRHCTSHPLPNCQLQLLPLQQPLQPRPSRPHSPQIQEDGTLARAGPPCPPQ